MKIAIVTGASSGLGVDFCRQLDERDEVDEIWMIARRRDRLLDAAKELTHAQTRVIVADLSKAEGVEELRKVLEAEKPQVRWMINNAGFGKIGPFESKDLAPTLAMIDLNVRALTELTHAVLPFCSPGSRIVQVASSAGFQPVPQMAVYAATKAYVVQFSAALHEELRDRGISVTALCPGPVETEFFDVAMDRKSGAQFTMAKPDQVVRQALNDASRGKLMSFPNPLVQAMTYSGRLAPWSLLTRALGKTFSPRRLDRWFEGDSTT